MDQFRSRILREGLYSIHLSIYFTQHRLLTEVYIYRKAIGCLYKLHQHLSEITMINS